MTMLITVGRIKMRNHAYLGGEKVYVEKKRSSRNFDSKQQYPSSLLFARPQVWLAAVFQSLPSCAAVLLYVPLQSQLVVL